MEEYTVIKKGQSIQPCINLPEEFKDLDLEIKIRPLRAKGDLKRRLENLFSRNIDIMPFEMIPDEVSWQKGLRDEWE